MPPVFVTLGFGLGLMMAGAWAYHVGARLLRLIVEYIAERALALARRIDQDRRAGSGQESADLAEVFLFKSAELRKAARAARLAADAAEARLEEFTRILETVANGKDKGNG